MATAATPDESRTHIPWQVDWKNPQWQSIEPVNDLVQNTDVVVDVACAQVNHCEIPRKLLANTEEAVEEDDETVSWLLSVTLLAEASGHSPTVATKVLLELTQTDSTSSDSRVVCHRELAWPETITAEGPDGHPASSNDEKEKEANKKDSKNPLVNLWEHLGGLFQDEARRSTPSQGVLAAALCRQPPRNSTQALKQDAMEAIATMGFGLDRHSFYPDHIKDSNRSEDTAFEAKSEHLDMLESLGMPELHLACITSQGVLCVYSPWDLLLPTTHAAPSETPDSFRLDQWFLGDDLYQHLESTWRPLCQPQSTISLSVLGERHQTPSHRRSAQSNDRKLPIFLEYWNPWMEPSTLRDATVRNRATRLQVVGDWSGKEQPSSQYLVVLGQGIPYRSLGKKRKPVQGSAKDTVNPESSVVEQKESPSVEGPDHPKPQESTSMEGDWWNDDPGVPDQDDVSAQEAEVDLAEEPLDQGSAGKEDRPWWSASLESIPNEVEVAESNSVTRNATIETATEPQASGGFVILCSTNSWSESRTLFLPFEPKSVSHLEEWLGMEWLICIGDEHAVAIRLDNRLVAIPQQHTTSSDTLMELPMNRRGAPSVSRFQVVPIEFPSPFSPTNASAGIRRRVLCSGSEVKPPALLQLFTEQQSSNSKERGLVLMQTLSGLTSRGTISTRQDPAHVAQLPLSSLDGKPDGSTLTSAWAFMGQGWSLVGVHQTAYFVCWEGATNNRGVYHIRETTLSLDGLECHWTPILRVPHPFYLDRLHHSFTEAFFENSVGTETEDVRDSESQDIVAAALESMSEARESVMEEEDFPSLLKRFASREKNQRLLRQCSSWTQLEDSQRNRGKLERQLPMITVKCGSSRHSVLTLRQVVVENGSASPFPQVLGWLSLQQDYFTAASVGLDLLRDADSLFHLWKNADKIDEDDEQTKLEGLLDGILPVRVTDTPRGINTVEWPEAASEDEAHHSATFVQLADMTAGCLIKGGLPMSKTLHRFLRSNTDFDPARACLMLVAAASDTVSGEPNAVLPAMGVKEIDPNNAAEMMNRFSTDDFLWPVRCLVEIGVGRDFLPTALTLLNGTVPNELRRRPRLSFVDGSVPDMALTKGMISVILSSHASAVDLLMSLDDDQTNALYWESLGRETQMELSLIALDKSCPLLLHPEVREWARQLLDACIRQTVSEKRGTDCKPLRSKWLQSLAAACLTNAGCHLPDFVLDPANVSIASVASDDAATVTTDNLKRLGGEDDGLFQHKSEIIETRSALEPSLGSGGLDFDILIPCLLLLTSRRCNWHEGDNYVSTQELLDATCYLAGRKGKEAPLFPLDGATAMRQCALVGNIRAGANLVGGKSGFVLSCCDILMLEMQVSMEVAEDFFLNDKLLVERVITKKTSSFQLGRFELNDSHRQLLWLLHEHVLGVRTYGDFEVVHERGKVDPVFCARSVFRAWLCLTHSDKKTGSTWLASWLKIRLGLADTGTAVSSNRLVCAALGRSLFWTDTEGQNDSVKHSSAPSATERTLGEMLEFDNRFLVQLAQSCCGLVESVPPTVSCSLGGVSSQPSQVGGAA